MEPWATRTTITNIRQVDPTCLVHGHRPQLDQEGVPRVTLVRMQCGEGNYFVAHQGGENLGQVRIFPYTAGQV